MYKQLEGKETAVDAVSGKETALQIIEDSINSYVENFCRARK